MKKIDIVKNRFVFIVPSFVFHFLFYLLPIILMIILAFFSWDLLNSPSFVGLENFKGLIQDKWFWNSIVVTLKYTFFTLPIVFVTSLILGLLLQEENRFSKVMRIFFYWPYMIPMVAGGTMWKWLLSRDFGLVNHILNQLGFNPVSWLENPTLALLSVVIVQAWVLSGFMMMLYIVGLQAVPEEFYEAASIDGASNFQKFWFITLPLLRNTHISVITLTIANCFRNFTIAYIMTTGGPGYATTVAPLYIYQKAFTDFRIGYSSAGSIVILLISLVIAYVVSKVQERDLEGGKI
ncbi:carbohydrate ABC transporter permease [Petrotoga olearia]|uniref:Carbohydrate ABC transporter membrane protein 1 (CUT1 family) n=1 Tax=Petrotoga olearia TaxID=156203 RepID=A0ABX9UGV3_9BACT|nr:sugar ABC transporter permease [Petrotoga olearia]RMA76768.1 carbohydrate ABC transporter membrane protein 1 (CUT1 family) [Petrotoga olearia]